MFRELWPWHDGRRWFSLLYGSPQNRLSVLHCHQSWGDGKNICGIQELQSNICDFPCTAGSQCRQYTKRWKRKSYSACILMHHTPLIKIKEVIYPEPGWGVVPDADAHVTHLGEDPIYSSPAAYLVMLQHMTVGEIMSVFSLRLRGCSMGRFFVPLPYIMTWIMHLILIPLQNMKSICRG